MNYVFLIIIAVTSFQNIHKANTLKVYGLHGNLTDILNMIALKGAQEIPNFLPDLTFNDNTRNRMPGPDAARRYIIRYIDSLKKVLHESKEFVSDDFTDYDEVPKTKPKRIGTIGELALRTINEDFKKIKEKRKEDNRVARMKKQHEDKMNEIIEFMKPNYYTTMYLHYEVRRIKSTHVVIDPLREMVQYVESHGKENIKQGLLKCFEVLKKRHNSNGDMWNKKTNNLVINTVKDPVNYGFIN